MELLKVDGITLEATHQRRGEAAVLVHGSTYAANAVAIARPYRRSGGWPLRRLSTTRPA
jgi:hypothetical protein